MRLIPLISGAPSQTTITLIRDEDRIAGATTRNYTFNPGDLQYGGSLITALSVSAQVSGSPPSGSINFILNGVTKRTYTVDTSGAKYIAYIQIDNPNVTNTLGISYDAGTTVDIVEITARVLEL